jgi:hypothetical protein
MAARAADAGKSAKGITVVEIALHDFLDDGPEVALLLLEAALIFSQELVEVMEQDPIKDSPFRMPRTINPCHDKELWIKKRTKAMALSVSAATVDRLLRPERKKYELKSRARTKPGTLLKHQIPIRTFSEWNEGKPGFLEIDLVGHDGGNSSGTYLTLMCSSCI